MELNWEALKELESRKSALLKELKGRDFELIIPTIDRCIEKKKYHLLYKVLKVEIHIYAEIVTPLSEMLMVLEDNGHS